jgi:hypothetical protein
MYDMDQLINKLVVKLGKQAERQKTVLGVQAGMEADAERIVNAADGEVIRIENPAGAKEFKFGGGDAGNQNFLIWSLNQFNMLAGNLEALGGLSPQSSTASQDQMLQQQAGVQIDDMRDRTVEHVRSVLKKIAWHVWSDMQLQDILLGEEQTKAGTMSYVFDATDRKGDFLDYAFDIEPYSMLPANPKAEFAKIMEMLQGVFMPMAQVFMQQGAYLDAQSLTKILARYGDVPDMANILKFGPPVQPQGGEGPGMPPVTTRRYERVNRSGTTPRGLDQQVMQGLQGIQRAEAQEGM